jgi:Leucine-rich repeat (LRR) protein
MDRVSRYFSGTMNTGIGTDATNQQALQNLPGTSRTYSHETNLAGFPAPVRNGENRNISQPRVGVSDSISTQADYRRVLEVWNAAAPPDEIRARELVSNRLAVAFDQGDEFIRIKSGEITSLPDCLFLLKSLESICIEKTPKLRSLPTLPEQIKRLDIEGIENIELPSQWPSSLEKLRLVSNNLTELQSLPAGLLSLEVYSNYLTRLPHLPKGLKTLEAGDNHLNTLPELPDSLEKIDLKKNRLTVLTCLPIYLKFLDVSENQLIELPEPPMHLQKLVAACNHLTHLPELVNVLELNISRNRFTELQALPLNLRLSHLDISQNKLRGWSTLPLALRSLNVSKNQLTKLYELPIALDKLDVSGNHLSELQALPLDLNLETLDASQNGISSWSTLPSALKYLNLSHNRVSELCELPPGLRTLSLCDNDLRELPALSSDLNLRELSASNNQITRWSTLPSGLTSLSLGRNQLQELSLIPPGLRRLDVSGNQLSELSCVVLGLDHLDASHNELSSFPPLSGNEGWMSFLDISRNQLKSLPLLPATFRLSIAGNCFTHPLELTSWATEITIDPDQLPMFEKNEQLCSFKIENEFGDMVESYGKDTVREWRQQNTGRPLSLFWQDLARANQLSLHLISQIESNAATAGPSSAAGGLSGMRNSPENTGFPTEPENLAEAISLQTLYDLQSSFRVEENALPRTTYGSPRRPTPRLNQPLVASSLRRSGGWQFPQTEDAVQFNAFANRLPGLVEYRDERTRPAFIARVDALVSQMDASQELRTICFELAWSALETCEDRIASGLTVMELTKINLDVEGGVLTTLALFKLAEGMFKLDAVEKITFEKIKELTDQGLETDDVEIRLAYQTRLAVPLNLPVVPRQMRYRGAAGISDEEIALAVPIVEEQVNRSDSVEFIARWQPWRQKMERLHPNDYRIVRDAHLLLSDGISSLPPRMSEGQWLEAFPAQTDGEEQHLLKLTLLLTRKFILEPS